MGNILSGAQPRKSTNFVEEQRQARLRRITGAMGPRYLQLLALAKRLQDVLPRYPDLQNLITQTFSEMRELQGLVDKDQEALLAKVRVIHMELRTYEDNLLEVLEKLEAYTAEEQQPQTAPDEKNEENKPLQDLCEADLKERLQSMSQGVRQRALLGIPRGCQEIWKKTELQCKALYPEWQQLDHQDCVSVLVKTSSHLTTLLQTVSQAARRPCLLEERVQLVSSQAERLCVQLRNEEKSGDLPSSYWVRFLRVFQRLLFLCHVCSLLAK